MYSSATRRRKAWQILGDHRTRFDEHDSPATAGPAILQFHYAVLRDIGRVGHRRAVRIGGDGICVAAGLLSHPLRNRWSAWKTRQQGGHRAAQKVSASTGRRLVLPGGTLRESIFKISKIIHALANRVVCGITNDILQGLTMCHPGQLSSSECGYESYPFRGLVGTNERFRITHGGHPAIFRTRRFTNPWACREQRPCPSKLSRTPVTRHS